MNNKNRKETDWDIVVNGMKTVHLLKVIDEKENINKTMREILYENSQFITNDYKILNKGVLMMAAYLQFVYIEETEFDRIKFDDFDFRDFIIEYSAKEINNKHIANKLRNSISHGRFKFIENDLLRIEDCDISDKEINFKATIHIVNFGKFIDDFALKMLNYK